MSLPDVDLRIHLDADVGKDALLHQFEQSKDIGRAGTRFREGHKTGHYLDQRDNRVRAAAYAACKDGARV
ncbi:MAG: hypothetical protein AAF432_13325, partial [Planctomycetota bacterium]